MKHRGPAANQQELDRALAVLISSTKRKRRPVSLIDVAAALSTARKHFGSTAEVARAIGLSAKMLGQFSRVDDLDSQARALVADRTIDSVDAVVQLAQLVPSEQQIVARAVAAKQLDSKDVRAVVEMRKSGSNRNVSEVIESIRSTKTQRHYVIEFIVRSGVDEEVISKRLKHFIPATNIIDVLVQGRTGRIVFDQPGYAAFRNEARRRGVTVKQLATLITTQEWM